MWDYYGQSGIILNLEKTLYVLKFSKNLIYDSRLIQNCILFYFFSQLICKTMALIMLCMLILGQNNDYKGGIHYYVASKLMTYLHSKSKDH